MRKAWDRLVRLPSPMPAAVAQYVRLFKPRSSKLRHARLRALIDEVCGLIEAGHIERDRRLYPAPAEHWAAAFSQMAERHAAGKINTPLGSHGYLLEILVGLADQAAARAEAQREERRRIDSAARGATEVKPLRAAMPDSVRDKLRAFRAPKGAPDGEAESA